MSWSDICFRAVLTSVLNKSMVFMRFGTLLLIHIFTLTPSDRFQSLSMESRAPKLPPICLPCYQCNRAVHARIPLRELLASWWQGKEIYSGRFSVGCSQRQSHGGCKGCASGKPVDQVVVYRFLSYPNNLEVCTYRARVTPEGSNSITLRSETKIQEGCLRRVLITKTRRPHHRLLSFSSALHLGLAPAFGTFLQPTAVPSASLVLVVTNIHHHRSPGPALSHHQRFCHPGSEESEGIVMKCRARQSNA